MRVPDALRTLGLSRGASRDEVKEAFRRLAKAHHPDVASPELRPSAEASFKEIAQAYSLLNSRSIPRSASAGTSGGSGAASGQWQWQGERLDYQQQHHHRHSRGHRLAVAVPFMLIVSGTVLLGVSCASRKYHEATRNSKSSNPFLP